MGNDNKPDPRDYRPNVGIMLLNQESLVFVAQRADTPGPAWQMPQGGIDEGESPLQAAFRELEEEIGTASATLLYEHPDWVFYDLPPDLQGQLWGGAYKGQRQKWFLMRFTGEDTDIHLSKHHPPEFTTWKWVQPRSLPMLAVDFKKQVYGQLLTIFRNCL